MASCNDCVHVGVCSEYVEGLAAARGLKLKTVEEISAILQCDDCDHFKDRARFVELPCAEWIEDEDMYGDPIYRCSNCDEHFILEEGTPTDNGYFYCPNCGAQMSKEREENAN